MTPVWNYDGTPTDHSLLFFVLESEPDIIYTGFTVGGHFYHISEMGRVPLLKGSKVKAWRYASKEDLPGTPKSETM